MICRWGYREAHEDPRDWRADRSAETPRDLLHAGMLDPAHGIG